ncbi:MAG TPA: hypothetical protein VFQ88_09780, partial [Nevskiaceae bacterium]|nr:hypothetical protein [Nevskiaceae bacterium]
MKLWHLSAIAVAAALSACATQQPAVNPALQQQLDQAQAQNNQLQSQNAQLHAQLQQAQKPQQPAETQSGANTAISLVPPNAEPGECFAKVDTPAVYKTSTSKLLKSAASTRVVTTQPQYGWTTQRIMVQPEITKLVAVP